MEVRDRTGDKIGKVGKLYHLAATGTRPGATTTSSTPYFKVDTGFLGLGKDLFIPASHIREVTADGVLLDVDKDQVDRMGWDQRPAFITD
jgi:hypothetical protein